LGLWEQFEGREMSRAYHGEVAMIEGGDLGDSESLSRGYN